MSNTDLKPNPNWASKEHSEAKIWGPQDIRTKKKAFITELKTTVMDNDSVHLEGYFFLEHRDSHGHTWREYISVIKKYRFYYASKEGKMSNHVKYDYDTMLQGLFLQKRGPNPNPNPNWMLRGVFLEKRGADEYHQQFASTDPVVARQALSEKLCNDVKAMEEQGRRYGALQPQQ